MPPTKLTTLRANWPKSCETIATGGSVKDFVNRLFPGKGNFATASKADYLAGVRLRFWLVVGDLRPIYGAYLREHQAQLVASAPSTPSPAETGAAELNQLAVALLTHEPSELDNLTDRLASDQPVNRPAVGQGSTP